MPSQDRPTDAFGLGLHFSPTHLRAILLNPKNEWLSFEIQKDFRSSDIPFHFIHFTEALIELFQLIKKEGITLNHQCAITGCSFESHFIHFQKDFLKQWNQLTSLDELQDLFQTQLQTIEYDKNLLFHQDIKEFLYHPSGLIQFQQAFQSGQLQPNQLSQCTTLAGFLSSILLGKAAPLTPTEYLTSSILDRTKSRWTRELLHSIDPNLYRRIPDPVPHNLLLGSISTLWSDSKTCPQLLPFSSEYHDLSKLLFSLDPHSPLISLGESDLFIDLKEDDQPSSNELLLTSPWHDALLSVKEIKNGERTRRALLKDFSLSRIQESIAHTTAGNRGRLLLPFNVEDIHPKAPHAQVFRFGIENQEDEIRGLFEAQALNYAHLFHQSPSPSPPRLLFQHERDTYLAQALTQILGQEIPYLSNPFLHAMGSALRALEALGHENVCPKEISTSFKTYPVDLMQHSCYQDLYEVYQGFVDFSLHGGKNPEHLRLSFMERYL